MSFSAALRSGITVASDVLPRRGYCWLKTLPNTPRKRPEIWSASQFLTAHSWAQVKIKTVKAPTIKAHMISPRPARFTAGIKRLCFPLLEAVIVLTLNTEFIKCSQLKLNTELFHSSERFSNNCGKANTKVLTLTNRNTNKLCDDPIQSQFLAIIRDLLEAWGKWCVEAVIGFGSASHWLKKLGWDFSANL